MALRYKKYKNYDQYLSHQSKKLNTLSLDSVKATWKKLNNRVEFLARQKLSIMIELKKLKGN